MVKFLGYSTLFIIAMALRGYCIQYNWEWFIVPLGVIKLGFFHSLGIGSLVSLMTLQMPQTLKDNDTWRPSEMWILSIILSVLGLFFGYLYHSFM